MVCNRQSSYCDFLPIKSFDGVILINVYDQKAIEFINGLDSKKK